MARQFQFVTISNPSDAPSSKKRSHYSHAFRQAHAERRRKQTEKHRKEIASSRSPDALAALQMPPPNSLRQVLNSNKDPFSSLPRPLSAVEYVLLDHYIHVVVPFTLGHCDLFNYEGDHKTQLLVEWVGLAIMDEALMIAGILLSSCRYILQVQPDNAVMTHLALQYKQASLQTLQKEMNSAASCVSVMTVAKALALAVDEVGTGNYPAAMQHCEGVHAMVNASGGAEKIGLTGLMERMYLRFVRCVKLSVPAANMYLDCMK